MIDRTASPLPLPTRHSRWPARLDLLQSASGLVLALFLVGHMFFVASILISQNAFYAVARFFEGVPLFGRPYPQLVSAAVAGVALLFVLHAGLAMRKFPASYRQYRAFSEHRQRLQHLETTLWWLQLWTGFALIFLAPVHLYGMFTQPALIGPFESADRVWSGSMWPLYLLLLFAVEIHASLGLYRLLLKWGGWLWLDTARGRLWLRRAKTLYSAFFLLLGILTLLVFVRIGIAHADRAWERYQPAMPTATRPAH